MSEHQLPESRHTFITEFEGLRGLLAAWVVFGHILLISGFTYQDGWFGILFSPVLGVYAFMILSGFVITSALDRRRSSWTSFMTRRFFRLFPIYAVCMALAITLFDMSVYVSQTPAMARFGPENLERLDDVKSNFGLYLLVDVTLLQCLLPKFWFPYATETFLVPTWSLTIEWLFYIIAPLLIWMVNRCKLTAILFVGGGLLILWIFRDQIAAWNYSFNLGNALYFLTGICSYYLWKNLPEIRNSSWSKMVFWGLLGATFVMLNLPYKIWTAMMAIILYSRVHSKNLVLMELPRQLLNSKPLQFLGRTSYVTYLLHWIIIELVIFWLVQVTPGITGRYLLAIICIATVYPITYFLSDILQRYIEAPLMNLPKQWSHRTLKLPKTNPTV